MSEGKIVHLTMERFFCLGVGGTLVEIILMSGGSSTTAGAAPVYQRVRGTTDCNCCRHAWRAVVGRSEWVWTGLSALGICWGTVSWGGAPGMGRAVGALGRN